MDIKDQLLSYLQRLPLAGIEQRLPVWASVAVLVMLTHALAVLTWRILPVPEVTPEIGSSRAVVRRPAVRQVADAARDASQWHLFGKVELQKPKPILQDVTAAPDTRLNLKLRGVFSSDNTETARAIIADAKGEEDSYSIGDPVPGGAILHQIHKDRVILEHNGSFETLRLPVDEVADGDNGGASPVSRNASRMAAPGAELPTTGETGELLRTYRDALINNPQSVMGLVRAEPYQKDGQLKGYRIHPGKDRNLLRRFGLRSGDIVTSVNGVTMDNPIKALEVLRDLSSATQLTVGVERNGSSQSFSFAIGQ